MKVEAPQNEIRWISLNNEQIMFRKGKSKAKKTYKSSSIDSSKMKVEECYMWENKDDHDMWGTCE